MKPICIDLFCGLGGWTEGFLAEGWLSVWLLIIADNVMHVVINALALRYL